MTRYVNGLILTCLTLLLIGCASPEPIVKTETVIKTPPTEYVQPCAVPDLAGETNRDLLLLIDRMTISLEQCNADKAALREWIKAARGQSPSP